MQHDLVRVTRDIADMTFGPIVGDRVGERGSRCVENSGGNGVLTGVERFQPATSVFVPERESTISTGCRERALLLVEADVVHRVHLRLILRSGTILPMTLERERFVGILILYGLDGNPAFHTTKGETVGRREAPNTPCLVLERALNCAGYLHRALQINHANVAFSSADDE